MKRSIVHAMVACAVCAVSPIIGGEVSTAAARAATLITVVDGATFQAALDSVQPGDTIALKNGGTPYTIAPRAFTVPDGFGGTVSRTYSFIARAAGTAENRITIRSEDPADRVTLTGTDQSLGYVLYLYNAAYCTISDLNITYGAKGLILDNASQSIIRNVEISDVGDEALHLRDGTSNCLVEGVSTHGTGKVQASFGEGIYIGSDNSTWLEGDATALLPSSADGVTGERGKLYRKYCHDNIIRNCVIADCQAEPFDVKEGTEYTIIEDCQIDASNVSGANYADSHIDLKGNKAIVRGCTFTLTGSNPNFARAIMTNPRERAGAAASETANDNVIHNNTFVIPEGSLAVKVLSGSVGTSVGTIIYGNDPSDATITGNYSPDIPDWYRTSIYFREYGTSIGTGAPFHSTPAGARILQAKTPLLICTAQDVGPVSVQLISTSGRTVFSYVNTITGPAELRIPLAASAALAAGTYLVRYSVPGAMGSVKAVFEP